MGHLITSMSASVLIIYLAVQFRLKQRAFHREAAYLMTIFGILSFYFAWKYGFALQFSLNTADLHNIFGFLSLGLSLFPMILRPGGKLKLHCRIATTAAFFAILSIITGIMAYGHHILRIFGME